MNPGGMKGDYLGIFHIINQKWPLKLYSKEVLKCHEYLTKHPIKEKMQLSSSDKRK